MAVVKRIACCAVLVMTFGVLGTIGAEPAAVPVGVWPSFRGVRAAGIGDGADVPTSWDIERGRNVCWKTRIPGLGHSSPVVWGDHVYLTSAVSSDPDPYLRPGLYGDSPDHPEDIVHDYRLYCLDRKDGHVVWEQTAHSGKPQVKRHVKSTHANPTPATDGQHVVAFFGSEGLYCYDAQGKLLWQQDLGKLDAGAFNAPEIQWGFGSSPIIHDGRVVVLCDVNGQSFIATFDVQTGKELWRTLRDENPTWGTPTVHCGGQRSQVIVNGWKHIGGYDLQTGAELWRMHGGGDIPVPTPVVAHDLVFLTSAHGPQSPVYAIRVDAEGDITLGDDETSNRSVAWSRPRRGAYMPTPIVYGPHLYVVNDRGFLACYVAQSGEELYRTRLGAEGGTFTASPVAANGKLYITSEEGDVHVVAAAAEYRSVAVNAMHGVCLATPAISDGMLFIRTSKYVYAMQEGAVLAPEPAAPEVTTQPVASAVWE